MRQLCHKAQYISRGHISLVRVVRRNVYKLQPWRKSDRKGNESDCGLTMKTDSIEMTMCNPITHCYGAAWLTMKH